MLVFIIKKTTTLFYYKAMFGTAPAPNSNLPGAKAVPYSSDPLFLGVELTELLLKNELRGWSWVFAAPQLHSTLKDSLTFNF